MKYHDTQAFPGGNFLEVVIQRDIADRFLKNVRAVGCPAWKSRPR